MSSQLLAVNSSGSSAPETTTHDKISLSESEHVVSMSSTPPPRPSQGPQKAPASGGSGGMIRIYNSLTNVLSGGSSSPKSETKAMPLNAMLKNASSSPGSVCGGPFKGVSGAQRSKSDFLQFITRSPDRSTPKKKSTDSLLSSPIASRPFRIVDPMRGIAFVKACIACVEKRGVSEGIYRVSGGAARINVLINLLQRGDDIDFEVLFDSHDSDGVHVYSVGDVGGALKQYLRTLTDPLIPSIIREELAALASLPRTPFDVTALVTVQELFQSLPVFNFSVSRELALHLKRMSRLSETTKMASDNLAIVFGPSIMACPVADNPTAVLLYTGQQNRACEFLIDQAEVLFDFSQQYPMTASTNESEPVIDNSTVMATHVRPAYQCLLGQLRHAIAALRNSLVSRSSKVDICHRVTDVVHHVVLLVREIEMTITPDNAPIRCALAEELCTSMNGMALVVQNADGNMLNDKQLDSLVEYTFRMARILKDMDTTESISRTASGDM